MMSMPIGSLATTSPDLVRVLKISGTSSRDGEWLSWTDTIIMIGRRVVIVLPMSTSVVRILMKFTTSMTS